MEWGNPWAFAGLLAAPLLWWGSRAYLRRSHPVSGWLTLISRMVVLLLVLAALAQPMFLDLERRTDWLLLVDRSDSMPPTGIAQAEDWVAEALEQRDPQHRVAVMGFAGKTSLERAFTAEGDAVSAPATPPADLATEETDLEQALQAALAEFGEGRRQRLILISDGNETRGQAANTVASLVGNGIVVNALVPRLAQAVADASLVNIVAPAQVQSGDEYRVDVVVNSNQAAPGEILLSLDGVPVRRYPVELQVGENSFPVSVVADALGKHVLRAEIVSAGDPHPQNNTQERFIDVAQGSRVLLVTETLGYSRPLSQALKLQGLRVSLAPIGRLPGTVEDLRRYDVIVFDNVSGVTLTQPGMEAIRSYVEDYGGGFIMIGGDKSFGGGGYHDTPLEALLPVDMDVEMPIELASVALVLVIDRSDSMGTNIGIADESGSRLEIAKLASISAVEMLKPTDQVGIVGFDTKSLWFVPMGQANRDTIGGQLATMQPGGGTDIYVGLRTAVRTLTGMEVQKKHIIILSDGLTRSRPFEELIQKAVKAQITVSTVGLADMVDHRLLKLLAIWGSGRYYFTKNALEIPRIFTSETVMVSRGVLEEDAEFKPVVNSGHDILAGFSSVELPPLRGYVLTALKPKAQAVLSAPSDDPILAVRQVGLGRSVAFTADLSTAWGKYWVNWREYPRLVAQLVRWAEGSEVATQVEPQVLRQGDWARVEADLFDGTGGYLNRAAVQADVALPDGGTQLVALDQDTPGHYQGAFRLAGPGKYLVRVSASQGEEQVALQTIGLTVPFGQEYRHRAPNTALLAQLTEGTGGALYLEKAQNTDAPAVETVTETVTVTETAAEALVSPAAIMADEGSEAVLKPAWPYLLIAAMAWFLLDIAFRQLASLRRVRRQQAPGSEGAAGSAA